MKIYVLKLANAKWYVGKTDDVAKRYQQHVNGTTAWTRNYPPISIKETRELTSPFDEDKVTKEYMSKYGIANVRGGSYCNVVLDETQIDTLQREIWSAFDQCARCGRTGHFQDKCYAVRNVFGAFIDDEEDESDEEDSDTEECYRCGREGHFVSSCYARTHIDGYRIS